MSYDQASIQKALDRGAQGIQVPMFNSKEDANQAVKKAKFPPLGERGAAYAHRAARYGKDTDRAFIEKSNENILVIAHIETPIAEENFRNAITQGLYNTSNIRKHERSWYCFYSIFYMGG